MTIKRCPYCRSIINEADRYCNSCGTQLLFPEDESIEEPIPGDRIVEAEEEASPKDDLVLESIPAKPQKEKRREPSAPLEPDHRFLTRELPEMGRVEPPFAQEAKPVKSEAGRPASKPTAGDFEAGFPTSTKEMEEIAKLLASLEKKEKPAPDISPPDVPSPDVPRSDVPSSPVEPAFQEKDYGPPRREEGEKPKPSPARQELPLWAERVKEGETPGFRAPTGEGISRDSGDFSFDLPSESAEAEPGESGQEESLPPADDFFSRRGEETERPIIGYETRPRRQRRKRGFLAGLKARIYDILFITLVWVLAVWAASRLLRTPLVDLALKYTLEVGIFYVILLVGYFALFLAFLGETLGDRIGSSSR